MVRSFSESGQTDSWCVVRDALYVIRNTIYSIRDTKICFQEF